MNDHLKVTPEELADIVGVRPRTVRNWIYNGLIHFTNDQGDALYAYTAEVEGGRLDLESVLDELKEQKRLDRFNDWRQLPGYIEKIQREIEARTPAPDEDDQEDLPNDDLDEPEEASPAAEMLGALFDQISEVETRARELDMVLTDTQSALVKVMLYQDDDVFTYGEAAAIANAHLAVSNQMRAGQQKPYEER